MQIMCEHETPYMRGKAAPVLSSKKMNVLYAPNAAPLTPSNSLHPASDF